MHLEVFGRQILRGGRSDIASFRLDDSATARFHPRLSTFGLLLPVHMVPPVGLSPFTPGMGGWGWAGMVNGVSE